MLSNPRVRLELFGVPMDAWTMEETVDEIDRRISRNQFTQHVVVNVAKIVHMQENEELATAVKSCQIINVDGAGVVLGARVLGLKVPERVAGIDLFYRLLRYAEQSRKRVLFLGAKPDVLNQAVQQVLKTRKAGAIFQ